MKNEVIIWVEPRPGQGRESSRPDFNRIFGKVSVRQESRYKKDVIRLTLPFGSGEMGGLKESRRQRLWRQAAARADKLLGERESLLLAEDSLEEWISDSRLIRGKALPYLYMNELLTRAAGEAGIARKDMDILFIDADDKEGDSVDVDFLVGELSRDKNRFSILTGRPLYFERRIDEIYEDSGLPIRLTSAADGGNLVLDLGGFHKKRVRDVGKGAVYLDLNPDEEKIRYILARRQDITYYNRYMFSMNREIAENKWIQAVCYSLPDADLKKRLSEYGPAPLVRFEGFGTARTKS